MPLRAMWPKMVWKLASRLRVNVMKYRDIEIPISKNSLDCLSVSKRYDWLWLLGYSDDHDEIDQTELLKNIENRADDFYHGYPEFLDNCCCNSDLDNQDLIYLTKGYVLMEELISGWGSGSTAPSARLVDLLLHRMNYENAEDKRVIDDLTRWITNKSSNVYAIFGTSMYVGCTTFEEFEAAKKQRDEEKAQRQFEHKRREYMRKNRLDPDDWLD